MATPLKAFMVTDLRGGLNTYDNELAANECQAARNIEWLNAKCGTRRFGAFKIATTFSSGGPFTGVIETLIRHVPGTNDGAAELWAVDNSGPMRWGRMAASNQFAQVTPVDDATGNPYEIYGASIDGKLFLAYKSAVNRLHVWDGTTLRRAGLAGAGPPPAPFNTGIATAETPVLRYYRVRWGGDFSRRVSEPSQSVAFTPTAGSQGSDIVRPVPPGEGETQWAIEASTDNVTFYQLNYLAIATTTYRDLAAPSTYSTIGILSPSTGIFTLQPSFKFIAADQNRLLGFGSYVMADAQGFPFPQNRVWFSDIVGGVTLGLANAATHDAAERLNTTAGYFLDLDEADSGEPTGLGGPVNGNFYAFKWRQVWELSPTGDPVQPYRSRAITKRLGCIDAHSICAAEDELGRPAIYWMSDRGPYRYGAGGLEYIGGHIADATWAAAPTAPQVKAITLFHSQNRQIYFLVASGAGSPAPTDNYVYHLRTGGFSLFVYDWLYSAAAVMFANARGNPMSRDLKPYFSGLTTISTLYRGDDPFQVTDDGHHFFAALTLPIIEAGEGIGWGVTGDVRIKGRSASNSPVVVTTSSFGDPDQDAETRTARLLTWTGQSYVRAEDTGHGRAVCLTVTIADDTTLVNPPTGPWAIDRIVIPLDGRERFA